MEEARAAEGLATALWELDAGDRLLTARERAFRCYRSLGDDRAAGRPASWLGLDAVHFRGEVAVAQGWFGRAHARRDPLEAQAEHATLAVFEGMVALRVERARALRWDSPPAPSS